MQLLHDRRRRRQALPSPLHHRLLPQHGRNLCSVTRSPIGRHANLMVEHRLLARGGRQGDRWFPEYFYGRCCFCHFCTDYCPEFALEETVEYDIAEYTRDRLVWSPERLAKPPVKKDDKYVFSVEGRRGASQVSEQEH